jgi:large subunit ribosomal protein L13
LRKQIVAQPQQEEVVDASNLILGRMATYVAKRALEGNRIVIVNAEKAVISGTKARVVARAKLKLKTRTLANQSKAPTHPRRPDNYVRRVVRGMLPWKHSRGKDAFRRVQVFVGIPSEYQGKPSVRIDYASASKLRVPYVSVYELAQEIGGVKP